MSVPKVEKVTPIPPFTPSKKQREWLEEEKKKTGNSFAAILRGLMQEKVENDSAKRK